MKIGVVSGRKPIIYNELIIEAKSRGHQLDVTVPPVIRARLEFQASDFYGDLVRYDLLYYRAGFTEGVKNYIGQMLIDAGVTVINIGETNDDLFRNKAWQVCQYADCGIQIPASVISGSSVGLSYPDIVKSIGSPFVAKPVIGSGGKGVEIIKTQADFDSLPRKINVLYQEYIPHDYEYRVVMIGDKKIMYQCKLGSRSFKANQKFGARYEPISSTEIENRLLLEIDKLDPYIRLDIYCVDFMHHRNNGDLNFSEANFNVGWTNLTEHTGISLPRHLLDYFEAIVN